MSFFWVSRTTRSKMVRLFALELVERQFSQDRTSLLFHSSDSFAYERVNSLLLLAVQTGPDEEEQEANEQQRGGLEPLAQQRSDEQDGGGLRGVCD